MRTLLIAAIAGVFLFAGSAAVSWYLMNQQQMVQQTDESAEDEVTPEDIIPPVDKAIEKTEKMPVGLRPGDPMSVQAVLDLTRSVKAKEEELIDREKRMDEEEIGLEMLRTDLAKERKEIEALNEKVAAKIRRLEELVEESNARIQDLRAKQSELGALTQPSKDAQTDESSSNLAERLKTAKKLVESMKEDTVATMIKSMADAGDLIFAGQLIKSMDARKASKVLTNLDEELRMQVLNAAMDPSK